MLTQTSRYYALETATLTTPQGREVVYLRRRFLPNGSQAVILTEHVITQGDRLDNITARHLGDPEQFWLICDANNAMRPDDLTAASMIGNRLPIPLPQGG